MPSRCISKYMLSIMGILTESIRKLTITPPIWVGWSNQGKNMSWVFGVFVPKGKKWTEKQSRAMRTLRKVRAEEACLLCRAEATSQNVMFATEHFIYSLAAWTGKPIWCPDWENDSSRERPLHFQDNERKLIVESCPGAAAIELRTKNYEVSDNRPYFVILTS